MNETYAVTYTFNGLDITSEFITELEAVRQISFVKRMSNLELVSYSDNIDVAAYRY